MKRILAVLALGAALALSGCAGGGGAPAPATPVSAPETRAPATPIAETPSPAAETPTPTPTPTCATTTAAQARDAAIPLLPPPFPPEDTDMAGNKWDPEYSDIDNYDPCAELSWIVVPLAGGTGSSPSQVALFHRGEFVQAATEKSYGFWPRVTRLSDDSIEVVYIWPKDGESTANASGESPMTFTWNDAAGKIDVAGNPPDYL